VTIDSSGSWERPRLVGRAERVPPARKQKFALELKQAGFDRAGTTKSPQQACESMNELELDHRSRINTADEGTLERSVRPNIFESLDDGLVSKPVTPGAVAGSAAFALRIDTRNVRDILPNGFVRFPHRHDPRASDRFWPY